MQNVFFKKASKEAKRPSSMIIHNNNSPVLHFRKDKHQNQEKPIFAPSMHVDCLRVHIINSKLWKASWLHFPGANCMYYVSYLSRISAKKFTQFLQNSLFACRSAYFLQKLWTIWPRFLLLSSHARSKWNKFEMKCLADETISSSQLTPAPRICWLSLQCVQKVSIFTQYPFMDIYIMDKSKFNDSVACLRNLSNY